MAVNFGSYSGWKDLSDKGDRAVNRIVDAYAGKIKQDRADEMLQREDAIREAKTLSDETGTVHKMEKTVTDFSKDNVDVNMPSFKDGTKSFLSQSWDALKGTAGNIGRNIKRDETEYGVKDTGEYTNRYKENMERKTQYIDSNNDGIWGNEGDDRTQIGKDADYNKNEDYKRKQAEAFIRDGKSGIVYNIGKDGKRGTAADEYNTGPNGMFDPLTSQQAQYTKLVDNANIKLEEKLGDMTVEKLYGLSFGDGDDSLKKWLDDNDFKNLKPQDIQDIKNNLVDPTIQKKMKQTQVEIQGMSPSELELWIKKNPDRWEEYNKLNRTLDPSQTVSKEEVKKQLTTKSIFESQGIDQTAGDNAVAMLDYAYKTGTTDDKNSINKTVKVGKKNFLGQAADLKFTTKRTGNKPSEETKLLFAALPKTLKELDDTSLDNMELREDNDGTMRLIETDYFGNDDEVEVRYNKKTQSIQWKNGGAWEEIEADFTENF